MELSLMSRLLLMLMTFKMKVYVLQVLWTVMTLMVESSQSTQLLQQDKLLLVTKRSATLTRNCTEDNEGEIVYNPVDPLTVQLCKNSTWRPYQLISSTGKTKETSAHSCKEIKEAVSKEYLHSGVYWVQNQQIYCDMAIDGGGWTLVWQHTYMKYNPLSSKMFYFSSSYQPCVKDASHEEWCNVPNKAHFNPTEQMIVAYHKGTIVYAYKGYFNRNIDHNWTGAILPDAKKVIDRCRNSNSNGVPPAPSVHLSGILGLTFDKYSPTNYYVNCDTYERRTTLTKQADCRWHDCKLPSSISSKSVKTNMTMAIFVR